MKQNFIAFLEVENYLPRFWESRYSVILLENDFLLAVAGIVLVIYWANKVLRNMNKFYFKK